MLWTVVSLVSVQEQGVSTVERRNRLHAYAAEASDMHTHTSPSVVYMTHHVGKYSVFSEGGSDGEREGEAKARVPRPQ